MPRKLWHYQVVVGLAALLFGGMRFAEGGYAIVALCALTVLIPMMSLAARLAERVDARRSWPSVVALSCVLFTVGCALVTAATFGVAFVIRSMD